MLFGFGAAGIVAGLNFRRLGKSDLMWPTMVISSAAFIGALVALAYTGTGYIAILAIMNMVAALVFYLLQADDYERVKKRIANRAGSGFDLPVMIGLPWLVVLLAFIVAVPPESGAEKLARAEEYIVQGVDWNRKGEIERAISSFDEAIFLAPEVARAYYNRGLAFSSLDQREQAIQDFDEAIRLNPQDASAFFSRGVSWGALRDFQRAKSDYDEAIRLDPENLSAYYNRAIVHTRLGMDREARRDAGRAAAMGYDPSLIERAINEVKALR
ncbi:MAG: tetratricopeptide repeat protein [SAR202 cluster bacterium]|jgi:tetratricopeptide (TPR) repeat protein|nr:tetratricopeptide repeat protein [SAR202 cluster bacterium]